jgi:hypothetical protein
MKLPPNGPTEWVWKMTLSVRERLDSIEHSPTFSNAPLLRKQSMVALMLRPAERNSKTKAPLRIIADAVPRI